MTALDIARGTILSFLDSNYPSFPKPDIELDDNQRILWETKHVPDSSWYTNDTQILVPYYDRDVDVNDVECIHECGHWLAIKSGRSYPDLIAALGIAYAGSQPGEVWAEQFVRAYQPNYAGQDYPQLANIPCDPDKVKALAKSLTPAAPQVPPAILDKHTRLMYDSTKAADIPSGSDLVMGYLDGPTAWSDADFASFAGRKVVRICIFNDRMDAQVIDIEPGNNDASGAVPWIQKKWSLNQTPTVYCFSDLGPQGYRISDVRKACDDEGVKHPLFLITKDDGDASSFDPAGDPEIIGKQYANSDRSGGQFDISIVAAYWPGVDNMNTIDGGDNTPPVQTDPFWDHPDNEPVTWGELHAYNDKLIKFLGKA